VVKTLLSAPLISTPFLFIFCAYGLGCLCSALPPAKKTAGQIEKETDVRRSICLLFNPGPAIEAASLIIKKTVPFWRSFIQGYAIASTFPDT
jgi:hypothetical protein